MLPRRAPARRRQNLRILAHLPLLLAFLLPPLLWLLVLRTPAPCGAPGDGGDCPPLVPPSSVDVVGLTLAGGCVATASVNSLLRLLAPRRLRILARSPAACSELELLSSSVRCQPDVELLPGVTRESVDAVLQQRYGLAPGSRHAGRDTAGWLHQQLLKLGAVELFPDLSRTFLLWDMDMVALQPLRLRNGAGAVRRHSGGKRLRAYASSFSRLTGGLPLAHAADGSSFVAHSMVVEVAPMRAMLASFAASPPAACADDWTGVDEPTLAAAAGAGNASALLARMPRWAAAVLCALNEDAPALGFSEYAAYAAWTAAHAEPGGPGYAVVVPRGAWSRHPLGSPLLVLFYRMLLGEGRGCCPSRSLLQLAAAGGWEVR
jgi:hypothetical protein